MTFLFGFYVSLSWTYEIGVFSNTIHVQMSLPPVLTVIAVLSSLKASCQFKIILINAWSPCYRFQAAVAIWMPLMIVKTLQSIFNKCQNLGLTMRQIYAPESAPSIVQDLVASRDTLPNFVAVQSCALTYLCTSSFLNTCLGDAGMNITLHFLFFFWKKTCKITSCL